MSAQLTEITPGAYGSTEQPKRIYIAGPMTGYEDLNYPAFADTAQVLRNAGYNVVNPAEINTVDTEYKEAIRNAIQGLITCDAIWMLKGWTKSKGAMLEFQIANCLGLTIRGDF